MHARKKAQRLCEEVGTSHARPRAISSVDYPERKIADSLNTFRSKSYYYSTCILNGVLLKGNQKIHYGFFTCFEYDAFFVESVLVLGTSMVVKFRTSLFTCKALHHSMHHGQLNFPVLTHGNVKVSSPMNNQRERLSCLAVKFAMLFPREKGVRKKNSLIEYS